MQSRKRLSLVTQLHPVTLPPPVVSDICFFSRDLLQTGQVDMHGTPLESHIFATGIGNYIALPLLRDATKEYERMTAG